MDTKLVVTLHPQTVGSEAISRINIVEAEWQAREMLTFTRISEVESYLDELRKE